MKMKIEYEDEKLDKENMLFIRLKIFDIRV